MFDKETTEAFRDLPAGCGLIAVAHILDWSNIPWSVPDLRRVTRYSDSEGVPGLGVAVALASYGLDVTLCSDPDPDPTDVEKDLLLEAQRLGVEIRDALSLAELDEIDENGSAVIVMYERANEEPHFSLFMGLLDNEVMLPLDPSGDMTVPEFLDAWSAPGILRQAILCRMAVE